MGKHSVSYSTGLIKQEQSRMAIFLPSGLWILYKDVTSNQRQPSYNQEGMNCFPEAFRMERWKESEFLMRRLKSLLCLLSICHLWAWYLFKPQFPQMSNENNNRSYLIGLLQGSLTIIYVKPIVSTVPQFIPFEKQDNIMTCYIPVYCLIWMSTTVSGITFYYKNKVQNLHIIIIYYNCIASNYPCWRHIWLRFY